VSETCADLDPFFDGELSEDQAEAFRGHLVTCDRCQSVLRGRMQERSIAGATEIAAPRTRARGRRRVIAYLVPVLVAAAGFAIWLRLATEPQPDPVKPFLSLSIESRGTTMLGNSAHVRDILRAVVRGKQHGAIWVYLDDRELVVACPGGEGCRSIDNELVLELRLPALGRYSIVAIDSATPVMAPHGGLDVMLGAAAVAGAHVEIEHVDVY
jgi:hypothetical protein